MEILKRIEELEVAQLECFSKNIKMPWGLFFYNENNPNYYDANHAHVVSIPTNPKEVVEDTIVFYKEKEIVPRLYIYNIESQSELIKELKEKDFKLEEFIDPIQLWNNILVENNTDEDITIEEVDDKNYIDSLEVQSNMKELGGKEVREKAFREEFDNPKYTHFLLRYKGTPCSVACIFEHENQACLETVATLKEFRGRGLIGNLIYYIQNYVSKKKIDKFWVFPINEKVEKVYQKYGFATVGKRKTGHAFLYGKSIKEIHKG